MSSWRPSVDGHLLTSIRFASTDNRQTSSTTTQTTSILLTLPRSSPACSPGPASAPRRAQTRACRAKTRPDSSMSSSPAPLDGLVTSSWPRRDHQTRRHPRGPPHNLRRPVGLLCRPLLREPSTRRGPVVGRGPGLDLPLCSIMAVTGERKPVAKTTTPTSSPSTRSGGCASRASSSTQQAGEAARRGEPEVLGVSALLHFLFVPAGHGDRSELQRSASPAWLWMVRGGLVSGRLRGGQNS